MSTRTELLVQKLLSQVVAQNAQELHLVAGQQPVLRQDGVLRPVADETLLVEDFIIDIAKSILSSEEWSDLESQRSAVVMKEVSSIGRFQVRFYYQRETIAITVKRIPTQIPQLESLNPPLAIEKLTAANRGLIILSGPFDSGRSTFAAALLQQIISTRSVRVMTLEKPLEYLLVNKKGFVEQRQVGRDVESFDKGVALAEQEDIEVLFVSEVTSSFVADQLIEIALSDRLVIVVLTSDSSVRALEQFIAFAENISETTAASRVTDALQAVVNLRLVPQQSKTGRVYAYEIMFNTQAMQLALKDKDYARMRNTLQTSRQEGMLTLDQSLLDLVAAGIASPEAVIEVAHDPERLRGLLKNNN